MLRQGDSFVSFLFLIVIEGLARVIREAERKSILKRVKVGKD